MELTSGFLAANVEHDRWIDYHYAHCCLILGLAPECLEVTERLTHAGLGNDPMLTLAVNRLYAEALHAAGIVRMRNRF